MSGASYYVASQIDLTGACPSGGFPLATLRTQTMRVRRAPAWANPRIAFGEGRPMPINAGMVFPLTNPGGALNMYWTPTEGEVPEVERFIELEFFSGDVSAHTPLAAVVPAPVPGGYAGEIDDSMVALSTVESPVEEVLILADSDNAGEIFVGYSNTGALFPLAPGASLTLRVNDLRNVALQVAAGLTGFYIAPQRSYT